jgi:LysR family nitrogen assimilation transcriptional regulator
MDLKQLDYFVHVAELGSFTKAASLLAIAQPALSRQVRQLEVELKQTLLYRNGRGVSVTEAGKRLVAHARGILQQVDRARGELEDIKGAPVGRVVVGVPPSVGRMLTVPLVTAFRASYPGASLSMVEGLSVTIQEWLLTGRVDVGLIYNPVPAPAVEITPFLEEELFLIRPADAAKTRTDKALPLRELPNFPLIIPSRPHAIRMYVETQLANLGLKPNVTLEIDGVSSILDLVHEGHGCAVLSLNAVHGHKRRFTATPFARPRLTSHLTLAVSAQRPTTPLTRSSFELIQNIGPQLLIKALPR